MSKSILLATSLVLSAEGIALNCGLSSAYNIQSVCAGGQAYACMDWNMGSYAMTKAAEEFAEQANLAQVPIFGVGSVGHQDTKHNMGKCFEFTLQGVARPIIFQAINEGGDVASGNVDLQMAAGGEGAFLGCTNPSGGGTAMFEGVGAYPSVFGNHPFSGGPATREDCSDLPEWPSALSSPPSGAQSLIKECEKSFDAKLRLPPNEAALVGNSNPRILTRKWIPCPSQLVAMTGLKRTDDPSSPIDQAADVSASSHVTRMMDCCKPSAGWIGNVYNYDSCQPAVMACQADGFTRLDGSVPRFYSDNSDATSDESEIEDSGESTAVNESPSDVSTPVTESPSTSVDELQPEAAPSGGSGCCTWDSASGCQTSSTDWCGQLEERCTGPCSGMWLSDSSSPATDAAPTPASNPITATPTNSPTAGSTQTPTSAPTRTPTETPTVSTNIITDSSGSSSDPSDCGMSPSANCWNSGCTIQVDVVSWSPGSEVRVTLPEGGRVQQAWNAGYSQTGQAVTFHLADYNANSFGFNMGGSNEMPSFSC